MILGNVCTRLSFLCGSARQTAHHDIAEPERVAEAVFELKLDYAVITSVNAMNYPMAAHLFLRKPPAASARFVRTA